jgi:histidinol-phosphate aminotransferase
MVERSLVAPWIEALSPYVPGKPVEQVERELGITGSLKLASNENLLGPSPRALDAARQELERTLYYPESGAPALVSRLAERLAVSPAQVVLGNGSDEILTFAIQVFCQPGDAIVTTQHGFLMYPIFASARGVTPVEAPARERYWPSLPAMAELARKTAARIVFLANPSNPTGTWVKHGELEEFLSALGPDPVVVLDEAYLEFASDPEYPRALELLARRPHTILLRTFSKAYGLAGLRVGYGVTSAKLADYLNRIRTPFNVNRVAQAAALAALADEEHLRRVVEFTAAGMARLAAHFDSLGCRRVPSQANFQLADVARSGAAVTDALLRRGVIVRPMDRYGLPTHIRVTAGFPEQMDRFGEALGEVLKAIPPTMGAA